MSYQAPFRFEVQIDPEPNGREIVGTVYSRRGDKRDQESGRTLAYDMTTGEGELMKEAERIAAASESVPGVSAHRSLQPLVSVVAR